MESFNFKKTKEYESQDCIGIKYEGDCSSVSNVEEATKLLEEFIAKGISKNNMLKNVTTIRTILDDCIEKLLTIECDYEDIYELIQYENGTLTFYRYRKSEWDKELKVEYKIGDGLKIRFFDSKNDLIDSSNIEKKKELSNQALDQLVALIRGIRLDNEAKALIETYKLFYNENPDFSREDINLRMQTMILILNQFNEFMWYKFSMQDNKIESSKLTDLVNELSPLGEITEVKDPIKFDERKRTIIKIIGETLRKKVENKEKLNEALFIISKTIYASRFDINFTTDAKEVAKYPNLGLTYNDADDSIKLIKKMQEELDSANISV